MTVWFGGARRTRARAAATAICVLSAGGASAPAAAQEDLGAGEAVQLEDIDVLGRMFAAGWQGASDAVYDAPGGVAEIGRETIEAKGGARNAADLFRGVPGVNAVTDRQNPGLNVNVRGLQDQGRVNMSVDGARQNFQQSGHGATSLAYVDPELLGGIEIDKGPTSSAGGAGVIGGVVTFRTLEFDDLVEDGKDWGGRVNATTGSNALDFNGSLAAAAKVGEAFQVVGAVGRKRLGEYKPGRRGTLVYGGRDPAEHTAQDQWSWMLKAKAAVTDQTMVKLSYTGLSAKFSTGAGPYVDQDDVTTHTAVADWRFAGDSSLVELAAKAFYTRTENRQFRPTRFDGGGDVDTPAARVDYAIDTVGASLSNTSRFSVSAFDAALAYGGEVFHDRTDTRGGFLDRTFDPTGSQFSGSNPIGERGVGGLFATLDLSLGAWLKILLGGRYDRYGLTGDTLEFSDGATSAPVRVDSAGGRFSPTATVAVTPLAGIQVYGSYERGYRPPNLFEAVLGGQHIGGGIYSLPNPNLKPEVSRTWEAGVNLKRDGVFAPDDAFRAKVSVYTTTVRDFITLATFGVTTFNAAVNLKDSTRLNGLDAEANYDGGRFYLGAAASFVSADYGDDYDLLRPGPSYLANLYLPPKRKLSLDGGLRVLERKLTVGGRVTGVAPEDNEGLFGESYQYRHYTLIDVYASYKVTEDFTVRAAVENIRDVAYVDAMGSARSPSPGRTFTLGATARF